MWVRKAFSVFFGFVLTCGVFLPAAHANEWDQMTELSFNQPVEVPHAILPAGIYWFVLASGPGNRNIVKVFSSNWSKLYTTFITVPADRVESTGVTEITFAERPANKPEAILKWYYPGCLTGHEFLYRTRREKEFAHDIQLDAAVQTLRIRP